jgi:ankyrin repeat protein
LPHELEAEVTPTSTEEWLYEATRQLREGNEELAESIYLMKIENNRDAFNAFRNEFYNPAETHTSDEEAGAAPKDEDAPAEQPEPRAAEVVQEKSPERDTETAHAEKPKPSIAEEAPEPEALQPVVKTTKPKKKKKQTGATSRFFAPPSDESIEKKFAQELFHNFSKERLSALLKLPRLNLKRFFLGEYLSEDQHSYYSLMDFLVHDMKHFNQLIASLVDDFQLLARCNEIIPLMDSCDLPSEQKTQKKILKQLMTWRWNLFLRGDYYLTPTHLATSLHARDVLKILHNLGADFNKGNREQVTAVHMAALKKGSGKIILLLHKLGADIRRTDVEGNTAFINAAYIGDPEALSILYKLGADINQANYKGDTPACAAASQNQVEVLVRLNKWGADLNKGNNSGVAPAHIAAMLGSIEILRTLKKLGVPLNKPDLQGKTPANYAIEYNKAEVLKVLNELEPQLTRVTQEPTETPGCDTQPQDLINELPAP